MKPLVRNASAVLGSIKTTEDKKVIAMKPCKIQIPARYLAKGLAEIGADIYIYGIYALILDTGEYAVSSMMGMFRTIPDSSTIITIDEVPYYEFSYSAGSILVDNINIVIKDTLVFNVFEEFIFRGNVPWFLNYEDMAKIFDTANEYSGSKVAANDVIIEMVISMISRKHKDRSKLFRLTVTDKKHVPDYVPLMSVFYSVSNTLSKLSGSYFNDGVISAIVNPSQSTSRIEQILRA